MKFTLEDWLARQHIGQWFYFTDSKNKIYANLIINGDYAKPTEEECNAGLAAMQADWDAKQYQRDRKYPSIQAVSYTHLRAHET